jgi:hypothetical protein
MEMFVTAEGMRKRASMAIKNMTDEKGLEILKKKKISYLLTDGGLGGEQHRVGPLPDHVSDVGDLCARGGRELEHGLEEVRGDDHGLAHLGEITVYFEENMG